MLVLYKPFYDDIRKLKASQNVQCSRARDC